VWERGCASWGPCEEPARVAIRQGDQVIAVVMFRLRSYLACRTLPCRPRAKECRRPPFLLLSIAALGGLTLSGSSHASVGIYAWGDNAQEQLVSGGLAIGSNRRLYGWAWNGLSPTDPMIRTLPHPEVIPLTATDISAGGEHSLAIGTHAATYPATALVGLLEATAVIGVLIAVLARRSRNFESIQTLPGQPQPVSPYL
jgi:hypothetical protein